MKTYEPMGGERIDDTAAEMVKMAAVSGEDVTASFNEIPLRATPTTDPTDIVRAFHAESNRRHEAYLASPEYARHQQEAKERQERRERELAAALAESPTAPTWKDEAGWNKTVAANTDDYGSAGVRYAEKWARIMEGRISRGESVQACAESASHIADDEGITGFMYGCAVSILSQCWFYGEELRRWHNLGTQIKDEGEKANESGGVLNPAILTIAT